MRCKSHSGDCRLRALLCAKVVHICAQSQRLAKIYYTAASRGGTITFVLLAVYRAVSTTSANRCVASNAKALAIGAMAAQRCAPMRARSAISRKLWRRTLPPNRHGGGERRLRRQTCRRFLWRATVISALNERLAGARARACASRHNRETGRTSHRRTLHGARAGGARKRREYRSRCPAPRSWHFSRGRKDGYRRCRARARTVDVRLAKRARLICVVLLKWLPKSPLSSLRRCQTVGESARSHHHGAQRGGDGDGDCGTHALARSRARAHARLCASDAPACVSRLLVEVTGRHTAN